MQLENTGSCNKSRLNYNLQTPFYVNWHLVLLWLFLSPSPWRRRESWSCLLTGGWWRAQIVGKGFTDWLTQTLSTLLLSSSTYWSLHEPTKKTYTPANPKVTKLKSEITDIYTTYSNANKFWLNVLSRFKSFLICYLIMCVKISKKKCRHCPCVWDPDCGDRETEREAAAAAGWKDEDYCKE